ncbi:hypothetical protein FRD01_17220 [Microvenator marinus]|uniref:Carbohydrate kinase PfkB domain-containing protein n=1 Tax=Microvenator marinus TaxID=2600177 RepID=A0A5B8XTE7_9DELT|nr:PfkB family carbohydrate kinase [Microvenator marinus]QED28950.1 hypothetical protein FRD01_17220 [Microvenator marinus]
MKTCIVGHITHDLYPDGIYAGGCSFYGGMVHKALGAEVVLRAGVGLNFQCDAEIEVLNPILRRIGETTTFKNEYPENAPRVQWVESLAEPLPAELEEDFDLIHLAPVLGELDFNAWVRAARPRARLLGINVQGWIKAASSTPPAVVQQVRWAPDPEVLKLVDVACLSDEDLIDQPGLFELLRAHVPVVALTHGREGAEIFATKTGSEESKWRVGIFETEVADPTGAGDAFAAAFLNGIASGKTLSQAAAIASAASSLVIEARGGKSLPRVSHALSRADRIEVEELK